MSSVLQTCNQLSLQICSHYYCCMNAFIKSLLFCLSCSFIYYYQFYFNAILCHIICIQSIQCAHFFEDEQMCCRKLTQRKDWWKTIEEIEETKAQLLAQRNLFPKLIRKRRVSQLCQAVLHRNKISITFRKINLLQNFDKLLFINLNQVLWDATLVAQSSATQSYSYMKTTASNWETQ
ncbi:hypothetical protein ABPG74_004030 [Tetrahymena malaccensis]